MQVSNSGLTLQGRYIARGSLAADHSFDRMLLRFLGDGAPEFVCLHASGTSAKLEQPRGADGNSRKKISRLGKVLAPLQSLASLKAAVPFALNQSGSTLFYYLLSSQGELVIRY